MPIAFPHLAYVALGGAIGASLRFLFGRWAIGAFGSSFPFGTWGVNILGGLAIGLLVGTLARTGGSESLRLLLGVGALGGFTTFSAFSLELYEMIIRGETLMGLAYAVSSVAGSVVALWIGVMLTRMLP